ncbi:hypothetical protein CR513_36459, partial [Mucuna pruriens]
MEILKSIFMSVEEKLKLTKESNGKKVNATQYKSLIGRSLVFEVSTLIDGICNIMVLKETKSIVILSIIEEKYITATNYVIQAL